MSAVAALAVASPAAVVAVSDLSASVNPAPQRREFVQAAMITDLPNELMSALSQGLSQFGINLPPMPTDLLTGSGSSMPTTLTSPGLGTSPLTTPGLGTTPLTTPGLTTTPLTAPGLDLAPATVPGLGVTPGSTALTDTQLTNPALSSPTLPDAALTSPLGQLPDAATGMTTLPAVTDPALAPISVASGLPAPSEVPISAPIGLDPLAGTYPVDPSLAAMPASTGGGGIFGDLSSMANQLGAGQAIDLLKGMVMPAIMSAVKPPAAPIPAAPPIPPVPVPGA